MNEKRHFSELDIHAFLDGEMPDGERAEFESWLEKHPDMRADLEKFQSDRDLIRRSFDPVLGEPFPDQMVQAIEVNNGRSTWQFNWLQIAAALLIFVGGASLGFLFANSIKERPSSQQVALADQAINAHRIYVREVRHPVEVGSDQEAHLVAWLSKRLGQKLVAPDLTKQGFELVGGRLLPYGSYAAAQFMYENTSAVRMTLYIARNPGSAQTAFRLWSTDDVKSFYWLDGPLGYALSGPIDKNLLLKAATTVYEQINN